MEHADVEQQGWIERYHQGRLTAKDEVAFEAHFTGCSECLEQLMLDRGLRRGLRRVAAEEATQASSRLRILTWMAPCGQLARVGMLLILFLATVLPSAFFLSRLEPRPNEVSARPQSDIPVFLLSSFRGQPGQPVVTIDLKHASDLLILAVEVDDDPRFVGYRVRVSDAAGNLEYEAEGLEPNALQALMMTFPSSFLPAGDYRLGVEGMDESNQAVTISGYPFRIVEGSSAN